MKACTSATFASVDMPRLYWRTVTRRERGGARGRTRLLEANAAGRPSVEATTSTGDFGERALRADAPCARRSARETEVLRESGVSIADRRAATVSRATTIGAVAWVSATVRLASDCPRAA